MNPYLSALFAEAGKAAAQAAEDKDEAAPSTEEGKEGKDAKDGKDKDGQAEKVAQANRQDLEGRVAARVYLQCLSKLGVHVPPRVELTDEQVKAAGDGASLAVRAVVQRRRAA